MEHETKEASEKRGKVSAMRIAGLQKLTLLDYPGKMACTIFTPGCNFRCPFCHNAGLVLEAEEESGYSEEEVLQFLKKRQGILEGICVTGGEPLLQPGLEEFLTRIKVLGYAIKLDTNGSFPEKLKLLAKQGLIDYVAMDVKNSKGKYTATVGVKEPNITPIDETVSFLLRGTVPYEFRTTVVKELHTQEDMEEISIWTAGAENFYLQMYEDRGRRILSEELQGRKLHGRTREEMECFANILSRTVKNVELRGI